MNIDFEKIAHLLNVVEKATAHGGTLQPIVDAGLRHLREMSNDIAVARVEEQKAAVEKAQAEAPEPVHQNVGEPKPHPVPEPAEEQKVGAAPPSPSAPVEPAPAPATTPTAADAAPRRI